MTRLAALALLLAGCASTASLDVATRGERTTWTTRPAPLLDRDASGGLVARQRVSWSASASCLGEGCRPDRVEVAFINGSDAPLDIDPRRVIVTVDGRERNWDHEGFRRDTYGTTIVRGEFLRVEMDAPDFARLAASGNVTVSFGRTGTRPFVSPQNRREPFRALAAVLAGAPE